MRHGGEWEHPICDFARYLMNLRVKMVYEEWRPKMHSESVRWVHLRHDDFVLSEELRPNRVGRDLFCRGGGRGSGDAGSLPIHEDRLLEGRSWR